MPRVCTLVLFTIKSVAFRHHVRFVSGFFHSGYFGEPHTGNREGSGSMVQEVMSRIDLFLFFCRPTIK